MLRRFVIASVVCGLVLACGSQAALAQGAPGKFIVLDTGGFWRMHHTLSEPVIRFDDGLKPIPPAGADIKQWQQFWTTGTPGPAKEWMGPEFNDLSWCRGTGGAIMRTPYLERLCLRGKVTVADPAKAPAMTLSLDFYGGAVVYLNGKEIARKGIKAGDAVAEDYPESAFVGADGKLIAFRGNEALLSKEPAAEDIVKRMASRTRSIEVALPKEALRKGLNVIAIEIVRAPYHKVLDGLKVVQSYKSKELTHDMSWNTCELRRAQLTAASGEGLVSSALRPRVVQVWNSDPLATDFDMDFGDPAEALRPIGMTGARNGMYSGKVVVGSTEPIKGLKATIGDLAGEGGSKIAAAQIRIRYATPWGVCRTSTEGCFDSTAYPADAKPLYCLQESPPAEVPVYEKKVIAGSTKMDPRSIVRGGLEPFKLATANQPEPANGAVAPVWVTVKVPKDARPGLYKGSLAIEVGGKKLADVPVELKVCDWVVPDPADYWTWVDLVQSPDVLSIEYKAPLWSEKHFDLIAHSMKYIAEAGGRILYVPLIAHTNLGNAETMVRWTKKGENSYDYDFTVAEKYVDAALKAGVKPRVIVLNAWDLYTFGKGGKAVRFVDADSGGLKAERGNTSGEKGPLVTELVGGKAQDLRLPTYSDAASKALWKPVFDGLRERLAKRGLDKTMMIGMISDDWCSKEQVEFFQQVAGDIPWVSASHGRHDAEKSLYGVGGVGYQAHAFGVDVAHVGSLKGWAIPRQNTLYERWGGFPVTMLTRFRAFPEYAVTGNTRGVGRVGADFWRAIRDKSGNRSGFVWERYPEAYWHQLSLVSETLAPGEGAAVATPRYEALHEGTQDAEAIIQIEKVLNDKASVDKLGPDLAKKAREIRDEHHRAMWVSVTSLQVGPAAEHAFAAWRGCYYAGVNGYRWFQGSGWQERNARLYEVAGEVARKLGK